jgi:hypothetical protein
MRNEQVRELLEKIFENAAERGELARAEFEARKRDFVFHLSDCANDLERLATLLRQKEPDSVSDATVQLLSILYHVIPHLSTAGRILLGNYSDPFANDWPVQGAAAKEPSTVKAPKNKVSA